MARVTLAMASSSMTRWGRLESSAMARGTELGSGPESALRLAAPRVEVLVSGCFMEAVESSEDWGDWGVVEEDSAASLLVSAVSREDDVFWLARRCSRRA